MKKLYYTEGMPVVSFGDAGEFRLGIPKDVPDDLAEILLKKGRLKEFPAGEPAPSAAKAGRKKEE